MERLPNDLTTDTEIEEALAAAKALDREPRALSAEYVGGRADVFVIRLSTGGRLTIAREELQGLQGANEVQASEIELWGGGISLAWPQLDVDHYLPYLLEGRYGSDAWMEGVRAMKVAA